MGCDKVKSKLIKLTLLLCAAYFLTMFLPSSSTAATEQSPVERAKAAWNLSLLGQEQERRVVLCFDVCENGYFAVGYRGNTIQVYDQNGVFCYGYQFETEGTYGIAFHGENLVIYLARSHIAIEMDHEGNCVGAEEFIPTVKITQTVFNRKSKQIGSMIYSLERDIGIFDGDYSRLVATDAVGNRTVLYDVTTRGYFVGIFHYLLPLAILLGFVYAIRTKIKQNQDGDVGA